MILYYTYKQKTKIFAQALSEILNLPTYQLNAELNNKSGIGFMLNALMLTFTGKTYPVTNMPQEIPLEIYVCSPIWGGRLAAPVKYFLENTHLQRTMVNLVLTASVPTLKYEQTALEYLRNLPCIPGEVYLFAASDKMMLDEELLKEQLRDVLGVK